MFDNKKKLTDKEIQDYIDRKYKKTSGFEDLSTIVVGLTSLVGLYMETPSETVSTFFKIFIPMQYLRSACCSYNLNDYLCLIAPSIPTSAKSTTAQPYFLHQYQVLRKKRRALHLSFLALN